MFRPAARFLLLSTIIGVAFSIAAAPAFADEVTGRVVDADGRPLAGARVLASGDGIHPHTALTDDDGRFAIEAPAPARLVVRVAADGFRAEARAVDASAGTRDLGTIALAVGALSESVVVSASQVEVPLTQVSSSVTVITGAELIGRQLHSVSEALRTVPGLTVTGTGGTGTTTAVFPRGGESNYTLVLIDGVPANTFGGDFDFGQVSTANIERIEIVRGPQSALFGSNAIGSVVRIVTRAGGPTGAQFSVEGGQPGSSRLSGSSAGHHGSFEWGALFDQVLSDGRNGERIATGAEIVNDDYERRSGALSAGWRDGATLIRGDFRYSTDDRGFPGPFGSNPIGAYDGIDAISRGTNDRAVASLSVSGRVSSKVRGHAQAGYNRLESRFASPFGGSESFSRRWIGRAQADIVVGRGVDASLGVELQRERAGSTFITGSAAQQIPISRTIAGYFGEARWNARDRVFLVAGARVEDIRRRAIEPAPGVFSPRPLLPSDTIVSVNPRLSGAWIVRSGGSSLTKLRASTGTGIRPPDAFELAFTDNPGLKPERSVSGEAGIDHSFAGSLGLLEATAFYTSYDDLIVAVGPFNGSSRFRTDNISNARSRGLEAAVTLRGRIRSGRPVDLAARLGYTWLDTEVLAVDQDNAAPPPFVVGQALLRRPRHQFFADLSMSSGRLDVFLRGGGRSKTLDVEPTLGTFGGLFDAPGHQVWGAGASWRLTRFADLFARVDNLFDRTYEEAFGFPSPGRRATAGLRIAAGR